MKLEVGQPMDNRYITIKDAEGILRPKSYLERVSFHGKYEIPKLHEGEEFIEIELVEIKKKLSE